MAADHRARVIRVLVAELPPIVQVIVRRALSGKTGIELLEPSESHYDPLVTIAELCPDVVIVPAALAGPAAAYQAAMRRYPSVRILEIGERPPDIYEVRLLATNPDDDAVVEAIQAVVDPTA